MKVKMGLRIIYGKSGSGNHHSDEGSRRRPAELLASACWHDENAFL